MHPMVKDGRLVLQGVRAMHMHLLKASGKGRSVALGLLSTLRYVPLLFQTLHFCFKRCTHLLDLGSILTRAYRDFSLP